MDLIRVAEAPHIKRKLPDFRPGDTLKVHGKVIEGDKERIQVFEGTVISRRGHGVSETFTVRRISYSVGVERTFMLHSPRIAKIEVVRSGKVRRAKLFYLRSRTGRDNRITEERQVRGGAEATSGSEPESVAEVAAPAGAPLPAEPVTAG